jgi:hypothetical protein
MPHPQAKIHRMFELVEPIATVTFSEMANKARLAAVVDGLHAAGRVIWLRMVMLTDVLAAPAYDVLSADELDELAAGLEPIAAAVGAVDD